MPLTPSTKFHLHPRLLDRPFIIDLDDIAGHESELWPRIQAFLASQQGLTDESLDLYLEMREDNSFTATLEFSHEDWSASGTLQEVLDAMRFKADEMENER